jgi:hypothetical protein
MFLYTVSDLLSQRSVSSLTGIFTDKAFLEPGWVAEISLKTLMDVMGMGWC